MHIFICNYIVDNLNERVLGFDQLFEKGTYICVYIYIYINIFIYVHIYRCGKHSRELYMYINTFRYVYLCLIILLII
jgi:hypothetical protein